MEEWPLRVASDVDAVGGSGMSGVPGCCVGRKSKGLVWSHVRVSFLSLNH